MSKYPRNAFFVNAKYDEQILNAYKNNPLIEALPTFEESKDIYNLLNNPIPFQKEEREQKALIRRRCLTQLTQFFRPLGFHMDMAENIINVLYHGYENRNPFSSEFARRLNGLAKCAKEHELNYSRFIGTNAETSGFSIIGMTGMGKTSCVNRVLTGIPQVIIHDKYKNEDFPYMQITWMKIECPFDGSVKGLCGKFLEKFDEITGDNTFKKYADNARATTDSMMTKMATIAARHSLGVLIIDEFQNISQAKSGGKQQMMNYILNLVNTIGVPVILIGIGEAINTISENLMYARRTMGFVGNGTITNLQLNSSDWDRFIKELWKYQWTNTETPLTPELSVAVYMASAGIIGEAVKIFSLAQRKILTDDAGKKEVLTVNLIEKAYLSKEFEVERELIEENINKGEIQINVLKHKKQRNNDSKKTVANNNGVKSEYLHEDTLPGIVLRTNSDFHSSIAEFLENKKMEGGLNN